MSKTTEKADRCEFLMNNQDFQQAVSDVRSYLLEGIVATPASDTESLIDLKRSINLLDMVVGKLKDAINAGKLERFEESQPPFLQDLTNVQH